MGTDDGTKSDLDNTEQVFVDSGPQSRYPQRNKLASQRWWHMASEIIPLVGVTTSGDPRPNEVLSAVFMKRWLGCER